MIAVASVGEGLEEDVMVELRRLLAPVFDADILAMPGIPPLVSVHAARTSVPEPCS